MCKYQELQAKQKSEMDQIKMGFAYSKEQFNKMLVELGVTSEDELMSIGGNGFIRKTDKDVLMSTIDRHVAEDEEAKKDPEYVYDMFRYELGNHEFCITHELDDTLDACSVTYEELEGNEMFRIQLGKACKDYLAGCEY